MQDAVLFCVMVSIAGAILVPAFTSTIPQETHLEKEKEEKADEVLHQLMICRVNKSAHLNAEPILGELGDTVNVDLTEGSVGSVIDGLLKREQRHLTYADLCTDSVACQFNVLGTRVNVLTQNFSDVVTREVGMFLHNQLGDKYLYNFTVKWHPIVGFDFGGDIAAGPALPPNRDVYTATTSAMMPPPLCTNMNVSVESFRHYIEKSNIETIFKKYRNNAITTAGFRTEFRGTLFDLMNKTMWKGFDFNQDGDYNEPHEMSSIIDMVLGSLFREIQAIINGTVEEALSIVTDITNTEMSQSIGFDTLSSRALRRSFASLSDTISAEGSTSQMKESISHYIKAEARKFINETCGEKIHSMIQTTVNNEREITNISSEILHWIFQHVNICRAQLSLSIWEI